MRAALISAAGAITAGLLVYYLTQGPGTSHLTSLLALLGSPVSVPIWMLVLIGALAVLAVPTARALLAFRAPRHVGYLTDEIFGLIAVWEWDSAGRGVESWGLQCPKCRHDLVFSDSERPGGGGEFMTSLCLGCGRRQEVAGVYRMDELDYRVPAEIIRRVRTGERSDGPVEIDQVAERD